MLQTQNVKLNSGPLLHKTIKFAPPLANKLNTEYSDLEITIELVENMEEAVPPPPPLTDTGREDTDGDLGLERPVPIAPQLYL